MQQQALQQIRASEAFLVFAVTMSIIFTTLLYAKASPHIGLLFAIIFLIIYGLLKKCRFTALQQSMVNGAVDSLPAMYLFFLIGILIATFMYGGVIPTLIYAGFSIISGTFFYAIVFVVCAVIGVAIGSSLTTVATLGLAFIAIATSLDFSLAITAGAIVSGAFFGDKMSPISDTTILAASTVDQDLFTHIKTMMATTVPAFVISLIVFAFLSPSEATIPAKELQSMKDALISLGLVQWWTVLPLVALVVLAVLKVPALATLTIVSGIAAIQGFILSPVSAEAFMTLLLEGYKVTSPNEAINDILSRGGIASMFFTMTLIVLALSFGGLLFGLNIVQTMFMQIKKAMTTVRKATFGAATSAVLLNTLIGEQYLAILLTGTSFKDFFVERGYSKRQLGRVMEDAGTVVNPLVPWSVCGIFITSVLGVTTIEYIPYAIFCIACPIITVLAIIKK